MALKYLAWDHKSYDVASKVFNEKTGRLKLEQEWAATSFREIVGAKFTGKKSADDSAPPIRSLGIGTGEGIIEMTLLKEIQAVCPRINHIVVEPSHSCVERYKTAVESASTSWSGVNFEWHEEKFEEFQRRHDAAPQPQRFDFISAVHSLYYVHDTVEAVNFLYDKLADGGVLLIYSGDLKHTGKRSVIDLPELADLNKQGCIFLAADVKGALDALGVEYRTVDRYNPVDITEVFDESSEVGDRLLDFLTHAVDFRKNAGPDLLGRVLDLLKLIAEDTKTRNKNKSKCDGPYIDEYWQIFIVSK